MSALVQVQFSPDGRWLVSASFDKAIKLWDGVKGTFVATLRGHVGPVYQVAWSADSRLFVSGSKDSTLKARMPRPDTLLAGLFGLSGMRVWRVGKQRPEVTCMSVAACRLFGKSTSYRVQAGTGMGTRTLKVGFAWGAQVWEVASRKLKLDLPGHADDVFTVDWSPDGASVASGGRDQVLRIWRQ